MGIAHASSESPANKIQLIFDFLAFARHKGKKVGKTFDNSSVVYWHHLMHRDAYLNPECIQSLDNMINGFHKRDFQSKPSYHDWKGKGEIPPYEDPGCLMPGSTMVHLLIWASTLGGTNSGAPL
jgi:hypothetical protein